MPEFVKYPEDMSPNKVTYTHGKKLETPTVLRVSTLD